MVWQSERAFRLLCRQHGANLCYTPMINAHCLLGERSPTMEGAYDRREAVLYDIANADGTSSTSSSSTDRPLIAQFCATTPEAFAAAAAFVAPHVDAVDLNLGCPQRSAKTGGFGAFLMDRYPPPPTHPLPLSPSPYRRTHSTAPW